MIPHDFLSPERLVWLWSVPLLLLLYVGLSLARRGRSRRRADAWRLERVLPRQAAWKRHLCVAMATLSLAALILAWARPKGTTEVPRERATIIVVVDVSKSMVAKDVAPSRLEAAQGAAKEFVDMIPEKFNISFVTFAATARLIVPPTTDRVAVKAAIDNLKLAPSTAIGEGIITGLDSLALVPPDPKHPDDPAPASMVLMSDGATNIGTPSAEAAKKARDAKVPVFTIAYGTTGGYIEENGRREPVPVRYDELERVSSISGGRAYQARSKNELSDVYKNISSTIGYEKVDKEITEDYVWMSLLAGIVASLGVISIAARWP